MMHLVPCSFRDAAYRRPLILAELLGFHADVICLQEVDDKAFSVYFQPQLSAAGALTQFKARHTGC